MSTTVPKFARPIFKPREIKTAEKTQWYAEAEWADGTIEEIGQFTSISEAWNWIARHSRAWLGRQRVIVGAPLPDRTLTGRGGLGPL
jgi:hypothetical protein